MNFKLISFFSIFIISSPMFSGVHIIKDEQGNIIEKINFSKALIKQNPSSKDLL